MPHDLSLQSSPLARRRPSRGFTLIEMLVVIGIILLLIGMSVVGFNQIARHTKTQHTKAALETARAMLGEYEASAGKNNLASFRAAWDSVPTAINAAQGRAAVVGPGPLPTWDQYSAFVLAKLLELPNNKAIFDKLPSDQIQKTLQIPAGSGNYFYEILDGYGHPILFVPSIGLRNVAVNGQAANLKDTLQNDGRVLDRTVPANVAPNPRYFWMSAGADNNPQTGDDNHYSFEQ